MPDSFPESPYYDHPTIRGAALITGKDHFRAWFTEVDRPSYPHRVSTYHAITERLNGIEDSPVDYAPRERPPDGTRARVSPSWRPRQSPSASGKLPPVSTRLVNFTRAVGRQVVSVAKGERRKATPEVQAARRAICYAPCDYLKDDHCTHQKCGCRLKGIENKITWATEVCPIGKWPSGEPVVPQSGKP
jgi:hypothetical protein